MSVCHLLHFSIHGWSWSKPSPRAKGCESPRSAAARRGASGASSPERRADRVDIDFPAAIDTGHRFRRCLFNQVTVTVSCCCSSVAACFFAKLCFHPSICSKGHGQKLTYPTPIIANWLQWQLACFGRWGHNHMNSWPGIKHCQPPKKRCCGRTSPLLVDH